MSDPPTSAWTQPRVPGIGNEPKPTKFRLPPAERYKEAPQEQLLGTCTITLEDPKRLEKPTTQSLKIYRGPRGGVFLKDDTTGRISRVPWMHLWMRDSGGKGEVRNWRTYTTMDEAEREGYKERRPVVEECKKMFLENPLAHPERNAYRQRMVAANNRGAEWERNPSAKSQFISRRLEMNKNK